MSSDYRYPTAEERRRADEEARDRVYREQGAPAPLARRLAALERLVAQQQADLAHLQAEVDRLTQDDAPPPAVRLIPARLVVPAGEEVAR